MVSSLIIIVGVFSLFSPSYGKIAKIEKVSTCTGKQGQLTDISGITVKEGSQGWGISGKAKLLRNLPANTTVGGTVYKRLLRWIPVVPIPKTTVCEFLESKFWGYSILLKLSDLPTKCPVKKATFTVKDEAVDSTLIPWFIPTGCARIDFKMLLKGKTIACYRVILNVVSKKAPSETGFKCL